MAFTQTDLDRVDKAIARGELSVEIEGRRITYRSMDDLLKARDVIERKIGAEGTSFAPTFASFSDD